MVGRLYTDCRLYSRFIEIRLLWGKYWHPYWKVLTFPPPLIVQKQLLSWFCLTTEDMKFDLFLLYFPLPVLKKFVFYSFWRWLYLNLILSIVNMFINCMHHPLVPILRLYNDMRLLKQKIYFALFDLHLSKVIYRGNPIVKNKDMQALYEGILFSRFNYFEI